MHIPISGLEPADNGNGFHIRRADGKLVSQVDPVTRQATGKPQAFTYAEKPMDAKITRILPASEMSASQRNQTFDATIQQLNLVIVQLNALTQAMSYYEGRADDQRDQIRRLREFQQRPFWQRLFGPGWWLG